MILADRFAEGERCTPKAKQAMEVQEVPSRTSPHLRTNPRLYPLVGLHRVGAELVHVGFWHRRPDINFFACRKGGVLFVVSSKAAEDVRI